MVKANITWLTDSVATGGDLSIDPDKAIEQVDDLLAQGVTHIFDTRIEADDTDVWANYPEITYRHVGVDDKEGSRLPREFFNEVVEFARQAANIPEHKVLIHCHMGINRGPSAASAVLMDRGMNAIDAFRLIRKKRPQAAVYYFMDAFDAHTYRVRRETGIGTSMKARIKVESFWMKAISDPRAIEHTTRAIRAGHTQDLIDYQNARTR